jgi:Leucine-rich repeat (LRR) protein
MYDNLLILKERNLPSDIIRSHMIPHLKPRPHAIFPNLRKLILSHNEISGSIDDSLNSLTHLERINFNSNLLSGSFPDIENLEKLRQLHISHNDFTNELPKFTNKNLYFLDISNNKFQGSIGDTFKELPRLKLLDISNNQLEGKISEYLYNNAFLEGVYLGGNNFSDIPFWFRRGAPFNFFGLY